MPTHQLDVSIVQHVCRESGSYRPARKDEGQYYQELYSLAVPIVEQQNVGMQPLC